MESVSRLARNAEQQKRRRDAETGAINDLRYSLAASHHVDSYVAAKIEKSEVLRCTLDYLQELKEEQRHASHLSVDNNCFRVGLTLATDNVAKVLETIPNNNQLIQHLLGYLGQINYNNAVEQQKEVITDRFRMKKRTHATQAKLKMVKLGMDS